MSKVLSCSQCHEEEERRAYWQRSSWVGSRRGLSCSGNPNQFGSKRTRPHFSHNVRPHNEILTKHHHSDICFEKKYKSKGNCLLYKSKMKVYHDLIHSFDYSGQVKESSENN